MVSYSKKLGIIFNIQRFSIHDGPGIRTIVFLKGCPLTCDWCSNPESQDKAPQIMYKSEICINCNICKSVCKNNAIINNLNQYKIIKELCNLCLNCTNNCPSGALKVVGQYFTIEEIIKELLRDEKFYARSNGGVTLSGGEPLYQWEFTYNLLKACKEVGLNTAIETCGYGKWENLEKILFEVDTLIYDIKCIDQELHLKYTGVDNKVILLNAEKASYSGINMILRLLIIPGISDNNHYKKQIIRFLKHINAKEVHLLPYHGLGIAKYRSIGKEYKLIKMKILDKNFLYKLKSDIETNNINVKIGG